MSKRALRFGSTDEMPAGMRALYAKQSAGQGAATPRAPSPADAPGWVPGGAPTKRGSKYAAQPTEVDGIRFDSKAEARYYQQLKARVAAGEVRYFLRQVPFHLPGPSKYVVDFLEILTNGQIRWIDVKGVETPMFKMKKRQVEALYPGVVIEIVR